MKRCRCCRNRWPAECFKPGRAKCRACQAGCKAFRQRHYAAHREAIIDRTRAWKAALRADVIAVRQAAA